MTDVPRIAIDVRNLLGEGIIWYAARDQLLWCDIYRKCVYLAAPDGSAVTAFGIGDYVAAEFIVDYDIALVATGSGLLSLDLTSGETQTVAEIEADQTDTRPNDCRAAPGGSLWFSTMGHNSDEGLAKIYHVRGGTVTPIFENMECPNSICFSPAGDRAYFGNTFDHRIMTCTTDPATGLPTGDAEVFTDLSEEGAYPDGAVVDSEGAVWCAHWGAGRVALYRPDGSFDRAIDIPAPRTTCPCLGGKDLKTLFVTTMFGWMAPDELANNPLSGAVFAIDVDVPGLPERTVSVG
ncbi:MAG: SMP-30/gluconolactonase/LRE family protein [Ruegeria sp.]